MKATAPNLQPRTAVLSAGAATPKRVEWIVAIVLTAWALILQIIYASNAGALWRDEASSVNFAGAPSVSQMWDNFRFDNFPPLFAFVLREFGTIGLGNDVSYRVLGLVISILVVGAIWVAGWLMAKRPPILALALFALNPLAIKTDGAVRPYGLGFVFLILAIALIWAHARDQKRNLFVFACIASVLAVQTLYQATFFIAAAILGVCVCGLMQKQRRIALAAILIGGIAACSLAIDLPHLMHDWGKTKWVGQSSFEISKIKVTWEMLGSAFWRAVSTNGASSFCAACWCIIAACTFGLALPRREARPAVFAIVAGCAVYLCFLRLSGLHAQSWYFLVLMVTTAIWLDAILPHIKVKQIQKIVPFAALLLAVVGVFSAIPAVRIRATSVDLVAETLNKKANAKDVVLTMPWYYGITFGRYYHGKFTTVPPLSDTKIHRYDLVQKAMESPEPIAGLMRDMEQALRNGNTVWTIGEIILPDNNEPVPVLPPYTPGNGYSDSDYLISWSMQIAVFLAQHAVAVKVVDVPEPGPISTLEHPRLVSVTGWHD